MQLLKHIVFQTFKLLLLWVLLFDFQRILFSFHNWNKFEGTSFGDWLLTFVYSFRLDIATAAFLSILPLLILSIRYAHPARWNRLLFLGIVLVEVLIVNLIHGGEINAYPEWNHKLTSRVFMHLSNPDEVFRTADYGMTVWFIVYVVIEMIFGWLLVKVLFRERFELKNNAKWILRIPVAILIFTLFSTSFFILARGGLQQIPININSAYFTNDHVINDLSVNSVYYFGNSYLMYNKSEIDEFMPKIDKDLAAKLVEELYTYPKEHNNYIFDTLQRPNVVFVVMESWSARGMNSLSGEPGATPNFDKLAETGLLFTNIYATSSTSEIGNSSIFAGNPAIPEISISMQPEKHRKMHTINEEFQEWGYSSHYLFSGDLKYGNIGGFFLDHGFMDIQDENDFPSSLERGKLNYYDEDLYTFFLKKINRTKEPFIHCAFTGSTHSPFDQPKGENQTWEGVESAYMNSLVYADSTLNIFLEKCREQDWFDNTIFVFVADHGHGTPLTPELYDNNFYRIPFMIWGEPLKKEYRGKRIDKLGSQADIAATLMYQFRGEPERYPWSKDLLNPASPEFALHTVIRGYGWVTPKGSMTYHMEMKDFMQNNFKEEDQEEEVQKCYAFLTRIYDAYKNL